MVPRPQAQIGGWRGGFPARPGPVLTSWTETPISPPLPRMAPPSRPHLGPPSARLRTAAHWGRGFHVWMGGPMTAIRSTTARNPTWAQEPDRTPRVPHACTWARVCHFMQPRHVRGSLSRQGCQGAGRPTEQRVKRVPLRGHAGSTPGRRAGETSGAGSVMPVWQRKGQHPRGPLQRQTEAGRLPATVWGGVAGSAAGHTTSPRAHRVAAVRGPQPLGHPGGPGAHCPTAGAPPGWPEGIGSRRDEPPRAVCGGAGGKQTSQTRHQGFLLSFLKSTAPRRAVKGPFPGWEGSGDGGSWGWTPAPWERRPSGPYFFSVLL